MYMYMHLLGIPYSARICHIVGLWSLSNVALKSMKKLVLVVGTQYTFPSSGPSRFSEDAISRIAQAS